MKQRTTAIVRHAWGKSPACRQIGIASRFCSTANFWETSLRPGHPAREPDKAFHNPALCAAAIPDWPANHGLCSNRAVEVSWQKFPATSLSLCAVFSPANRSNSLECPSRSLTVAQMRGQSVFTQTQMTLRFCFLVLEFCEGGFRNLSRMNRKSDDAISFSPKAQTEWCSKLVHRVARFQPARKGRKKNFHSTPDESLSKKSSSIRGILSLDGQSSFGSTRNALARQSSSKSETHRSCVSILARVCRLKSQPHRRQRAANIGCVSFCWSRNRRICRPTRFRGFFFMFQLPNQNDKKGANSKGSEFRTMISLANGEAFSDFRFDDNFSPRQMKKISKGSG